MFTPSIKPGFTRFRSEELRRGFTLMELLIAMGIMAILAAIVLVAVNPMKQLNDAQNASRRSAIIQIENAMSQYLIDSGILTGIPSGIINAQDICQDTVIAEDCTTAGGYNLSLLTPNYLVNLPIDPEETEATLTDYRVYRSNTRYKACSKKLESNCGT